METRRLHDLTDDRTMVASNRRTNCSTYSDEPRDGLFRKSVGSYGDWSRNINLCRISPTSMRGKRKERALRGGRAATIQFPAPVTPLRTATELAADNELRTWRLYAHDTNRGETVLIATDISTLEADTYLRMSGHRRLWAKLWNDDCQAVEFKCSDGTIRYLVAEWKQS